MAGGSRAANPSWADGACQAHERRNSRRPLAESTDSFRARAAKLPECAVQGKRRSSAALALRHSYGMLAAPRMPAPDIRIAPPAFPKP